MTKKKRERISEEMLDALLGERIRGRRFGAGS